MNKIIEVKSLKKAFNKTLAVNNLDFYVESGKLFAFLGPNGAGKSTTIDILSTLLKPDSGTVLINSYTLGVDDDKIRSTIGIVFQESLLDPLLSPKENLYIRGGFYGLSKDELKSSVNRAAEITGITGFINKPYGKLSGGQRRRVDIARALINTPKILFLDEPTTGLDPQTRQNIWETIESLQRETGMTVFLTTHYMEEAAKADYVIVIDNGEISAKGTPLELKESYSLDKLQIKTINPNIIRSYFNNNHITYTYNGEIFEIPLKSTIEAIPIIKDIEDNILSFQVLLGNMDDVFLNITGKEIRE